MSHLTKSKRIRALLKTGKTTSEIAAEVGCSSEYVRVVRQRRDKTDPYSRGLAVVGSATVRARTREQYRELRKAGMTPVQANRAAALDMHRKTEIAARGIKT